MVMVIAYALLFALLGAVCAAAYFFLQLTTQLARETLSLDPSRSVNTAHRRPMLLVAVVSLGCVVLAFSDIGDSFCAIGVGCAWWRAIAQDVGVGVMLGILLIALVRFAGQGTRRSVLLLLSIVALTKIGYALVIGPYYVRELAETLAIIWREPNLRLGFGRYLAEPNVFPVHAPRWLSILGSSRDEVWFWLYSVATALAFDWLCLLLAARWELRESGAR